jgi:hypothetical protein
MCHLLRYHEETTLLQQRVALPHLSSTHALHVPELVDDSWRHDVSVLPSRVACILCFQPLRETQHDVVQDVWNGAGCVDYDVAHRCRNRRSAVAGVPGCHDDMCDLIVLFRLDETVISQKKVHDKVQEKHAIVCCI